MRRQDVNVEHTPLQPAAALAASAVPLRADDQDRINRALRDARAPNTWRVYRGAWLRWAAWAADRGPSSPPSSPITPSRAPLRRPCASTGPGSPPPPPRRRA